MASVEFALIASLFFAVLFGIVEVGRVLYYLNAATEATRLGARVAVVCDMNASAIKTRMQGMLPILTNASINVAYLPSGCNQTTCETVTVSIIPGSLTVNTFIPFLPFSVTMPDFSSTLPRESLSSTAYGNNTLCN
ncbi:MAG: TadE/TadG family type IV pilus assembly protein [Pseudomonadota bacterium]